MALALRLRRAAVALSSAAIKDRPISSLPHSSSSSASPLASLSTPAAVLRNPSFHPHSLSPSRSFQSSALLSDRPRSNFDTDNKDIGPDEILFEGCDYNHWLITMDFPKDPKPTPEEMVETYVQTLAKVVGSVEEAKKRMYACSTTTYQGFQAVMTEEMSEKFRGLPGVVFILPDSYIDPANKQYGGDKYDNGVITPRPPPIQYERKTRYNDQNRRYNQQRYDGPRNTVPTQQGSMPRDQQAQGDGRGYAPQQNYGPSRQEGMGYAPQQNYGPPGQDGRGYAPQQNYGPSGQDGRGYAPQQNYGPPGQDGRGYAPQQNYGPPGQDGRGYAPQQNYGPPGQDGRGYAPQQNYGPPGQDGRGYAPQQNYGPPRQEGRGYAPPQNYGPPGQDGRGFAPQQNYSPHRQDGRGFGPPGGSFGQEERRDNLAGGAGPAYGQSSPDPVEGSNDHGSR